MREKIRENKAEDDIDGFLTIVQAEWIPERDRETSVNERRQKRRERALTYISMGFKEGVWVSPGTFASIE